MKEPFRIYQDVYIIGSAEISHPYDCCVYLVDAGELALIDTGAGMSFGQLIDNISVLGFTPEKLTSVIVTHAHIDHIGSLSMLKQEYKVKVIAHKLDVEAIESGKQVGAEFYGVDYQPCQVDTKLEQSEQKISLGKHEFKFLHIPGHTPGSIAVYIDIDGKRVLFGQDIHGPYEPHWGGEPQQAIVSLQKLIGLKSDILCEGHFGIYQPAKEAEKCLEYYVNRVRLMAKKI